MNKQITIVGAGYVGLSVATLLSVANQVRLLEVIPDKVEKINKRISPIKDEYIEKYFNEVPLNFIATSDSTVFGESVYNADFIVLALPTNYDETTNYFDTHFLDDSIDIILNDNPNANIVIKSTIPVGYCESVYRKYPDINLFFFPEFLRESHALEDNLYPSRIICGCPYKLRSIGKEFANLLSEAAIKEDIEVLFMNNTEAEAVKLFANSYLAMRVSYFNELDTYAELNKLNTENIIRGISADPRIGNFYNNPSFGYGGYCFPKDTKQLLANYKNIPQNLISAIVESNKTRKNFIADQILKKHPKTVGVYRLIMKSDSDNFRSSAIQDIIYLLQRNNIEIIVYEPTVNTYNDLNLINNLNAFKEKSDIILANRYNDELDDVRNKVYTKDIFNNN